jgi:hypothetical protein
MVKGHIKLNQGTVKLGRNQKFHFGKYKGTKVREVLAINPKYIEWCMNNLTNVIFAKSIQETIQAWKDGGRSYPTADDEMESEVWGSIYMDIHY